MACGHRSRPRCQNHQATTWLARQQGKLLPLPYFLVTFTLPRQLRALAVAEPKIVLEALFSASSATLRWFGKHWAGLDQMGFCSVLHTHSRRLDVHPHVHVVVPGGGLVRPAGGGRSWRFQRTGRRYLFNARALAAGFRKRLLGQLRAAGLVIPADVPGRWIVDCRRAGDGAPALAYLSRYLYRGVLAESDLLHLDTERETVTFQYREGRDGRAKGRRRTRTMSLAGLLYLLCLHVLPTGFHRVRCYGFWHANAGKSLQRLLVLLGVKSSPASGVSLAAPTRPGVCCPRCQQPMRLVAILRPERAGTGS